MKPEIAVRLPEVVPQNLLYYGDNLDILRRHVADESVDLVYLDPPFKSNQDYNVLFAEHNGTRAASQIKAFEDTWQWDESAARALEELIEAGGPVSDAMQALRRILGDSDMMAYLAMMAPRLAELRRKLKPTGSIYLHCDPTASHYLKVLMDAVFGPAHFLNEIIWKRSHAHSSAKRYGPIHDVILYYSKSDVYTWTDERLPYTEEYVDRFFKFDDGDGRGRYWTGDLTANGVRHGQTGKPWKGFNPTEKGRHWMVPPAELDKLDADRRIYWPKSEAAQPKLKRYISEARGVPLQDIIDDIYSLMTMGGDKAERLGYPTQKPEALLERLIIASSRDWDVVLDPFCGCGTTIAAAQKLKRHWIGIDITHLAINLIKTRLANAYPGIEKTYKVIGEPTSLSDAEELAGTDPYQFQWWALGQVGARPTEQKKGADKGIDGRLIFHDEKTGGAAKQIIFSVKAGKVQSPQVRDLVGVIAREKAAIGVLISFEEPTRDMRKEAANAGYYSSPWGTKHPRIQLLTVAELLEGKKVDRPPTAMADATFKKAERVEYVADQMPLDYVAEQPEPVKAKPKRHPRK